MPKCNIKIDFDRSNRIYQAGETVAGTVCVQTDEQVNCKALTIELLWAVHGKGDKRNTVIQSKTESDQSWSSGAEQRYPFSFQLPSAPLTYHGHILNIDYCVYARADLLWSVDAKAEEMITVVPGAACEEIKKSFEQAIAEPAPKIRFNIAGLIMVLVIGLLAYFASLFFLIIMIFALFRLMKDIRSYIAEKKLGKVQAELQSTVVYPGQSVPVSVRFNTVEQIPVNSVTVTLTGEESCVSGSGRNARTHYHTFHKEVFSLSPSGSSEFWGDIKIPETGAYTFIAPCDSIKWEVLFYLDIPKLTDWQKTYPVFIVPRKPEEQKAS